MFISFEEDKKNSTAPGIPTQCKYTSFFFCAINHFKNVFKEISHPVFHGIGSSLRTIESKDTMNFISFVFYWV